MPLGGSHTPLVQRLHKNVELLTKVRNLLFLVVVFFNLLEEKRKNSVTIHYPVTARQD